MSSPAKSPPGLFGRGVQLIKKYTTPTEVRKIVEAALHEDIGPGDPTACIFSPKDKGTAHLVAKSDGIISGTPLAAAAFRLAGPGAKVQWHATDGQHVTSGVTIATITGPMTTLLLGERVALNFLQQLSGIATLTYQYVTIAAQGTHQPAIYDTRKTTPLLRPWQKKAVLDGGGQSHRYALYDMAMLKDNHIDAAGGISSAVQQLHENGFFSKRPRIGLCIEVRSLDEALEATRNRADIIMLDNMTPAAIKQAATAIHKEAAILTIPRPQLEISGGITLKNLKSYASLPVQRISVGALTHSAPALDISMKYQK